MNTLDMQPTSPQKCAPYSAHTPRHAHESLRDRFVTINPSDTIYPTTHSPTLPNKEHHMTFDTKEFVRRDFLSRHLGANGEELRSFYSLRENAWHNLGQVVEKPASDKDALRLAGLDWIVEQHPIYRSDMTPIDTHVAVVRGDNRVTLGVVGKGFQTVQNSDLIDWMRGLEQVGDVVIETAGALMDGSTVWVQARINELRFDIRGDAFDGYLSLTNGHTGNRPLSITPTLRRQTCNNTTRMITSQKHGNTLASGFKLRHSKQIMVTLDGIRDMYIQTSKIFKHTQEVLTFLANKPLTQQHLDRLFVEPWIPKPVEVVEGEPVVANDEAERASVIRQEREARLMEILSSETCNQAGTKDTLFSAWNAVTEYLEFESPTRGKPGLRGADLERSANMARLESNLDGLADERKGKALAIAMELAETA
jgi:phage/plasmid-like protein (TIGR03299 family)